MCELDDHNAYNDRDQRARNLLADLRPHDLDRERQKTDQKCLIVKGINVLDDICRLIHGLDIFHARGIRQPQEILHLSDGDRDRDTRGETRRDGVRDVFDESNNIEYII